jgi:hypothetical protein
MNLQTSDVDLNHEVVTLDENKTTIRGRGGCRQAWQGARVVAARAHEEARGPAWVLRCI